jgi:hypothetical protein
VWRKSNLKQLGCEWEKENRCQGGNVVAGRSVDDCEISRKTLYSMTVAMLADWWSRWASDRDCIKVVRRDG